MATKIQIRRDTAANWTSANPTLSSGELGYETDTDKVKVGDGTTAWTSLAYLIDPSSVVSNVVDDTTPQLGGNLDVNDNLILNATGPVKLQAGSADYVTIINSAGADRIRFSDVGGIAALGWYHQFGDSSSTSGLVNIMGSVSGFAGSGSLRIHDNDSSAHVELTVPATVSSNVTFTLPGADGTNGQVMVTDGSGNLSFATPAAGGISNLVEDTTPQLGGTLDSNGNDIEVNGGGRVRITGAGGLSVKDGTVNLIDLPSMGANAATLIAKDIVLGDAFGVSGSLDIRSYGGTTGSLTVDGDVTLNDIVYPSADGTNGQVLTTDGSGNLSFTTPSGGISNLVEDTTPQLGGNLDVNDNLILNATGPVKLQAGSADYVKIVNSSGDDKVRFSDQGGVQAFGTFHQFGDPSSGRGEVSIYGSTSGFFTGSGSLKIHDNDSSAYVELTVPTAVSVPITFTLPGADGTNGQVLTTDGSGNLSFADAAGAETTTTLTGDSVNQKLVFTDETGTPNDIDLSWAVDDTNLSRITSGSVDGSTGIATFSRDDASTFTVDFSALFDDTNLARINSGTLSGTTLTLIRTDFTGLDVDLSSLDSRYQPAGTYNTIIGTDTDINTSGSTIIDNIFVTDGVIQSMGTRTLTPADIGALSTSFANQEVNTNSNVTFGNLNINGTLNAVDDIYLANRIMHEGDTDTFMQFHAANEWRVYTGGAERLEVNNSSVTVQNDLIVNGGDITLGGTGRIQGIDTVSANTDAANKLYVDNAVAGAGGGISNVVEDTTPQLGGDLDIGGNYVGLANANMSAVDFGTGSILSLEMQGSPILDFFASPGPSSQSATLTADLEIRDTFNLQFETPNSIVERHSTRGVTELHTRYSSSPSSISVNVTTNGDTNINWISTNLTSNVTLNVNGITGAGNPSTSVNTVSILASCNVTDYIVNAINIDGNSATINWAGGSPPVPTVGGAYNLFTFTIIWDSSFPIPQVLGSHQGF